MAWEFDLVEEWDRNAVVTTQKGNDTESGIHFVPTLRRGIPLVYGVADTDGVRVKLEILSIGSVIVERHDATRDDVGRPHLDVGGNGVFVMTTVYE